MGGTKQVKFSPQPKKVHERLTDHGPEVPLVLTLAFLPTSSGIWSSSPRLIYACRHCQPCHQAESDPEVG